MRLKYPLGGPHVLLFFHTYYDKGHGILARTWDQAEKVFFSDKFQRHVMEEGDLKVTSAIEIEVVQPSRDAQLDLFAEEAAREREAFKSILLDKVKALGVPLPEGFRPCRGYSPRYDGTPSPDDHWDCQNCGGSGIRVGRRRFLELYAKARRGHDPLGILGYAVHESGDPVSRAPYADPQRDLWIVRGISGTSSQIYRGAGQPDPPLRFWNPMLCFYHLVAEREDVELRLQAHVSQIYASWQSQREATKQAAKAGVEARLAAERAKLKDFLG